MRSIDKILGDKLLDLVNYILTKIIKPDITIDRVTQLNEAEIENLKEKYGIEGIIVDVDNTLRKQMRHIPKCNKDWIASLRGKLKITILSNGVDQKIREYFNEIGIDYISFAYKPLKKNFIKACEIMKLPPEKVMVIGDNRFNDIFGGKRNNMKTALVKDVEETER